MTEKSEINIINLIKTVELQIISARNLLGKTKSEKLKLIVAVSGGEDSSCLLDVLVRQKEKCNLNLIVAHFDHALREESLKDCEFVKELCSNYQLEFFFKKAEPRPLNENLEAWARKVRYQFLEEVRVQKNADLILTAHHQQDQAETFLMRLLSLRMLSSSKGIDTFDPQRKIFRLFLQVKKEAILDYLESLKLKSVDDQSNSCLTRTRNRIRKDLLPKLEKEYNPDIVSGLCKLEKRLADDELYIFQQTEALFHSLKIERKISILLEQPLPLQWRILKRIAEYDLLEYDLENEDKILAYTALLKTVKLLKQFFYSKGESKKISLSGGVEFYVENKNYFGFRAFDSSEEQIFEQTELTIPGELKKEINQNNIFFISSQILAANKSIDNNMDWIKKAVAENKHDSAVEFFDLDRLKEHFLVGNDLSLVIRPRKAGDKIRVWKRGSRKLKKLFLEKGLRLTLRSCIPIVEYKENIIWVPGVARSEMAPVTEKTKFILELKYRTII